jgi:transcriptional regulator with XRE-family HTH domain
MCVGNISATGMGLPQNVAIPVAATAKPPAQNRPLQRLAEVRRLQGISRRTVARRLNVEIEQVRQQEQETADVPVSVLYAWQKVLDVPVSELLAEADDAFSSPIQERSQLVRLMKTVLLIREQTKQESVRRMAETLVGQLIEMMPELSEIGPWHTVGKRRRLSELGVAAQRRISEEVFIDRGL